MIHYRPAASTDHDVIRLLLAANGWGKRVEDAERFRRMMDNAGRTVTAWAGHELVGFGRALCDEVSNGYLSMIVVAENHRGRGIGAEIVRHLMGDDPDITWVLRAGRDSRGFWQKLGFQLSEIAMERTRTSRD